MMPTDLLRAIKQITKTPWRRYCYAHDSLMIDEKQCDHALWQDYAIDDEARSCAEIAIVLGITEDTK